MPSTFSHTPPLQKPIQIANPTQFKYVAVVNWGNTSRERKNQIIRESNEGTQRRDLWIISLAITNQIKPK
ncbi:hypothetical protein L2E82_28146 [Cichorium intybus]|uniref:Uncharacterized protein n=1 Tax=Cichorium intybus TaxID=13427 RepID=A0ACB9CUY8_CICIN|nr:hypothetical protein L2E82_28146 [Cichorium intybus]